MICRYCGEGINQYASVCPFCGSYQQENQSVRSQFNEEMGDALAGVVNIFLILALIAALFPVLILNPITIYWGQFRHHYFYRLSKIESYFILVVSAFFTLAFINDISYTIAIDFLDTPLFIQSLKWGVLISLGIIAIARYKEHRGAFSYTMFIILLCFFYFMTAVSSAAIKFLF